ncbi:uncharacterized protein P884DRAFT_255245 [Thermothelomyces heterothallicus CBS 202.75]|uniref:uncharacterized protein n=1 Tax=Thermothelomyces heterothallicus CBS 202.75 TaxID=1149848 RepID=UPI0037424E97
MHTRMHMHPFPAIYPVLLASACLVLGVCRQQHDAAGTPVPELASSSRAFSLFFLFVSLPDSSRQVERGILGRK